MSFPSSIDSFAGFTSTHTLSADNHASQHNSEQAGIIAVETKVGTGSSTPSSGTFLRGNGVGTSAWSSVTLSGSDVTGILPTSNGGTGQNSLTGLTLPSATLSSPAISGTVSGGATYSSPILTTPTIADFSNATHNHQNNAGGGTLNAGSALQSGSITASRIGTDSSFAWQSWTPSWVNFTIGNGTNDAKYTQIGKTVFFRLVTTLGSTSSMGTAPTFTLPVTSIATPSTLFPMAVASYYNTSSSHNGYVQWASTTTGLLRNLDTNNDDGAINSTTPFGGGWLASYVIFVRGEYEAA